MRGVVTGGAGFLGSHVADGLTREGHDITVVDMADSVSHRTIRANVLDLPALMEAARGAEFVCHLAAVGDVYLAMEKPDLAAAVNVTGTANVCEAALAAGVGRVVIASTWEVYGEPHYQPIDEAHPCAPDHPYSITKLAGERMAIAYARFKGLPAIALRLGTAYGTRMRPNSVFTIFARRALERQSIVLQGGGTQGRQFTHASDIASAFAEALDHGTVGEAYNVVGDEFVSIRELAETVVKLAPTELTFGDARPGDVPSARVTNERAKRELGWRPLKPFSAGVEEIVAEQRRLLTSASAKPSRTSPYGRRPASAGVPSSSS
jgi:UDP-glucose 4-epimerase